MRLLVLGMQSSGATLFMLVLGQVPDSLVVLDLWARQRFLGIPAGTPVAPALEADTHVALKCVVTTAVPFERHVESFGPDRTILFLRDPVANARSLGSKPYATHGGRLEEKLEQLETHYRARDRFDVVIHFEDFITDRVGTVEALCGLGWPANPSHYELSRSVDEVVRSARGQAKWCDRGYGRRWGAGRVREGVIDTALALPPPDPALRQKIRPHCPTLCDVYAERMTRGHGAPSRAWET